MRVYLGCIISGALALIYILSLFNLPVYKMVFNGKKFDIKEKIIAIVFALIHGYACIDIFQASFSMDMFFEPKTTKNITYGLIAFFLVNCIYNFASKNKLQKFITPILYLICFVCYCLVVSKL